jgi:hypothetical protein
MNTRATPASATQDDKVDAVPAGLVSAIRHRSPSLRMRRPWMLYCYPYLGRAAVSARRDAAAGERALVEGKDPKASQTRCGKGPGAAG